MKATVWGCRGSLATPGADTVRYGGNTSCVEVTLDSGHRIVLDAGTGMRPLGVQVNGDGLMTGGGFYPTGPDQLPRLRAAIDAPRSGQQLHGVIDDLARAGFDLGGDRVATRPRGVPADHPRLELMRFKNLIAKREHGAPAWASTPEVVDHVRADWRAVRPLVDWLTAHVGASTSPQPR